MGIKKNMTELISHLATDCIKYKALNDLKGMTFTVDIFIFIYKGILGYRDYSNGYDKLNIRGEIVTHLEYIFDKIIQLHKHNIINLWIFDGKAPAIKRDELRKRRKEKRKLQEEYENSPDFNPDRPNHKKNFTINATILKNLYRMLELMGVQYIRANDGVEADNLGSKLNQSSVVEGIITEDWDALPFGCDNLIKGFGTKDKLCSIQREELLNALGLNQEQFVDLCILLGTDYCPTISGLNGLHAYHMYYNFKDMNKLVAHLKEINKERKDKYVIPCDFIEKWIKAKEYYLNPIPQLDTPTNIIWHKPDRSKLIDFLCNECQFDRNRSIERVDKLMQLYYRYSNRKYSRIDNLDSWKYSKIIEVDITKKLAPNSDQFLMSKWTPITQKEIITITETIEEISDEKDIEYINNYDQKEIENKENNECISETINNLEKMIDNTNFYCNSSDIANAPEPIQQQPKVKIHKSRSKQRARARMRAILIKNSYRINSNL